jgi:hypothetical protein
VPNLNAPAPRAEFVADTEMIEYVCNENQKDIEPSTSRSPATRPSIPII